MYTFFQLIICIFIISNNFLTKMSQFMLQLRYTHVPNLTIHVLCIDYTFNVCYDFLRCFKVLKSAHIEILCLKLLLLQF